MANKSNRRRGRRSGFVAIPFQAVLNLGTLNTDLVLAADALGNALGEDLFVISIACDTALRGLTAGEGPITIGFAHSDLSVTEIAEALVAEVSDPDDIIAKERARRPVRRHGTFSGLATEEALDNGQTKKTTMKFSIGDGHNISCWAQNRSGANLTTGGSVVFDGTIFGRWQR